MGANQQFKVKNQQMRTLAIPNISFTWASRVLFMMLLSLMAVEHAFAGVPCTIDYKSYKSKLFKENWRPVPTSKTYGINSEVSSGNQFASAIWQKRKTNESIRIFMRWEHGNLCVLPQHSAL